MKKIISIIGGTWGMWKIYKKVFAKRWYRVIIASRSTKITPIEACTLGDLILITVPIDKTVSVIDRLAPYIRKDAILFDVTSIKSEPIEAMMKTKANDVVGIHPMHGPSTPIAWQNYILCKWRWIAWYKLLKQIFKEEWAKIVEMDADKHDAMMSIIQGLSHFTDIVFAKTLEALNVNLKTCTKLNSPAYKLKFAMMWRIMAQNADLYWSIQLQNKANSAVIDCFIESAVKLSKINKSWNLDAFIEYFNGSKKFLWNYATQALKDSDKIINWFCIWK